ncbi:hypothetical protein EVAR_82556_1 [Eumeta japonica]|uniref:Uncharacterized protein n=1 Tax=Eumeta variegata TaxID=151549 RepID=A0A4C1UYF6_EUMVA|nr:hypothetical protein EVAR_82556_1 [Eumeta japonica]
MCDENVGKGHPRKLYADQSPHGQDPLDEVSRYAPAECGSGSATAVGAGAVTKAGTGGLMNPVSSRSKAFVRSCVPARRTAAMTPRDVHKKLKLVDTLFIGYCRPLTTSAGARRRRRGHARSAGPSHIPLLVVRTPVGTYQVYDATCTC